MWHVRCAAWVVKLGWIPLNGRRSATVAVHDVRRGREDLRRHRAVREYRDRKGRKRDVPRSVVVNQRGHSAGQRHAETSTQMHAVLILIETFISLAVGGATHGL